MFIIKSSDFFKQPRYKNNKFPLIALRGLVKFARALLEKIQMFELAYSNTIYIFNYEKEDE